MNDQECLTITDMNFQHFEVSSTLEVSLQGLDFLERLLCASKSASLVLHSGPGPYHTGIRIFSACHQRLGSFPQVFLASSLTKCRVSVSLGLTSSPPAEPGCVCGAAAALLAAAACPASSRDGCACAPGQRQHQRQRRGSRLGLSQKQRSIKREGPLGASHDPSLPLRLSSQLKQLAIAKPVLRSFLFSCWPAAGIC